MLLAAIVAMVSCSKTDTAILVPVGKLNFGEVQEDQAFEYVVSVRNTTDRRVTVDRFEASCTCTSIQPGHSVVLAPGATREIKFVMDLTRAPEVAGNSSSRDFSVVVRAILADESQSNPAWRITGKVARYLELSRKSLDFGSVSSADILSQQFIFGVKRNTPLKELAATTDSADLLIETKQSEKRPYDDVIAVHFKRLPRSRNFSSRMTLIGRSVDGRRHIVHAKLEGTVVGNIVGVPELVAFGSVPIGSTAAEVVTLISRDGTDFEIREVRADGPVALERFPIEAGRTEKRYRLVLAPKENGTKRGLVTFVTRDTTGHDFELAVPFYYYGASRGTSAVESVVAKGDRQ